MKLLTREKFFTRGSTHFACWEMSLRVRIGLSTGARKAVGLGFLIFGENELLPATV